MEEEKKKLGFLRLIDNQSQYLSRCKLVFDIFLGSSWGLCVEMYIASTRKSFKDSLKVLEADIQHANTL